MELYNHKSGLGLMEPVALIDHHVKIFWANTWKSYQVTYLEPIPPLQFLNIGAVVAQTTSSKTAAGNLDLEENEFGQFRWFPIDNAQVRLWLPSATGRYKLKNILGVVDQNILDRDPCLHLTEFFEWEDERPSFEAINLMDYNLAQCRLVCMGYRYKVKAVTTNVATMIDNGTVPATRIVCQGVA